MSNISNQQSRKKKQKIIIIIQMLLLIFVLFLGISACAKNSSNSPVTASGKHSAKWLEKNHTPSNKKASVSLLSCTECHGENFNGGVSKVSCFTCHPKTGVHPESWVYDGDKFRAQKEVTSCSLCHGNDFQGGTSGLSCYLCHNGPNGKEHPVNWIHNHAAEVKVEISSCTHCHGDDYKGGINKISCYQCHLGGENGLPHQNEWNIDSTGVFTNHQTALYGRGYESCSLSYCHGEKLTGGELTISWGKAPSCSTLDYKEKNCHPEIPSL